MAQSRYYSSNAEPTVLTSGITNANTVINVMSAVGFPASLPFIIALDYNTASEELALVTGVAGTSWTVTRAYDGTSATSHNVGAEVRHTWAAIDGNDSRAHEGSSTNIHGIAIASAVVGTTDSQTLTNKSLTSPAITGSVTGSATYTGVTDSPTATTNPGLVVKGLAAQSGNLQEWQNSTGTVLSRIDSTGAFSTSAIGARLFAYKTADTARASTTVLAADPHLTVTAVANAVYRVSAMLAFTGDPAGDISFQLSGPAGFATALNITTQNSAATATIGQVVTDLQGTAGLGATITAGTIAGAALTATITGLLTTSGTPGAVFINWAQGSSNVTATTMKLNSHISLIREA